jgi:hypothetical protein
MATKKPQASCSSCGARIVWARTDNGKAIPLERCAAGSGTVAIQLPLLPGGTAIVVSLQASTPSSYRRHIETCPAASEWRQRWRNRERKPRP